MERLLLENIWSFHWRWFRLYHQMSGKRMRQTSSIQLLSSGLRQHCLWHPLFLLIFVHVSASQFSTDLLQCCQVFQHYSRLYSTQSNRIYTPFYLEIRYKIYRRPCRVLLFKQACFRTSCSKNRKWLFIYSFPTYSLWQKEYLMYVALSCIASLLHLCHLNFIKLSNCNGRFHCKNILCDIACQCSCCSFLMPVNNSDASCNALLLLYEHKKSIFLILQSTMLLSSKKPYLTSSWFYCSTTICMESFHIGEHHTHP